LRRWVNPISMDVSMIGAFGFPKSRAALLLSRRSLLGGSAAAALGATVGLTREASAQTTGAAKSLGSIPKAIPGLPAHGPYAGLVAATRACQVKGEACLRHCIGQLSKGDTSLVDCIKTVSAMLPICRALERYASISAKHLRELASLCTRVTSECETECLTHQDHPRCL
jgi:Cys-rich four helix bundle protein (predicted Tat secretion target)